MKKQNILIISIVLLVSIILTGMMPINSRADFNDVTSTDWFFDDVRYLTDNGLINGYPDGLFRPNDTMNVDQFIKTMITALGYEISLDDGYWAKSYIDKAFEIGLISEGDFEVYNVPIKRDEVAYLSISVLDIIDIDAKIINDMDLNLAFVDSFMVNKNQYRESIDQIFTMGILIGDNYRSFRPDDVLSRGEACAVIRRIIDSKSRVNKEILTVESSDSSIYLIYGDNYIIYNFDTDLDKDIDYKIVVAKDTPDNKKIQLIENESDEFKYMRSIEQVLDFGDNYGKVEITFHNVYEQGIAYYINYLPSQPESNPLNVSVISYKEEHYDIFEGNYMNNSFKLIKYEDVDHINELINTVNYLDGDETHIRLGRVFYERDLGRSVKDVVEISTPIAVDSQEHMITYTYECLSTPNYSTKVEGLLSSNRLIKDPSIDFDLKTLEVMDLANVHYTWTDGIYYPNMWRYEPSSENDFFRVPCAWLLRSCYWVLDQGSVFSTYGISWMYTYSKLYNDAGYIPTLPQSGWLYDEYEIGPAFYDTRFNTDTINALLYMQTKRPDPLIKEAIDHYFNFYYSYIIDHSFYLNGNLFVSDYMDGFGGLKNNIIPHCSLNHLLAEITILYQYYLLYSDEKALQTAEMLMSSIENTADNWIKDNGDLYYAITRDGVYFNDDYPLVTYNDLNNLKHYLEEIYGEVPEYYIRLLERKEQWAIKNGYIN